MLPVFHVADERTLRLRVPSSIPPLASLKVEMSFAIGKRPNGPWNGAQPVAL